MSWRTLVPHVTQRLRATRWVTRGSAGPLHITTPGRANPTYGHDAHLNKLVSEKDATIARQENDLATLKREMAAIKKRLGM